MRLYVSGQPARAVLPGLSKDARTRSLGRIGRASANRFALFQCGATDAASLLAAASCGGIRKRVMPASPLLQGQRPLVPLSAVERDGSAILCEAQIDAHTSAFIGALGLTQGCSLRVCRRGEPCIVQVRTTRIGISASLAKRLLVILQPPVAPQHGQVETAAYAGAGART